MTMWQCLFIAMFICLIPMAIFTGAYIGYLIYKANGQTFKDFLKDTFKKGEK